MKILLTAILLLALYGYGWVDIEAHTPCDGFIEAPEPEPTCGYESAVNPLTGDYEANYVCK